MAGSDSMSPFDSVSNSPGGRGRSTSPRPQAVNRSRSLSPTKLPGSPRKEYFAGYNVTTPVKRTRSRSPMKKAKELLGIGSHGVDATMIVADSKKLNKGIFAGVKSKMAEKVGRLSNKSDFTY